MNRPLEEWINRWWWPLLAIGAGLHVTALFGTLTEPDSALYATVAKHMAQTGDLINLVAYRGDWLDKPHFLFWVASTSMRLFGVNEVAWRLPSVAAFLLGVHYTWRLGRLLFDRTVARLAVLLLLVAEHTVLSDADVRMEPMLVGLNIAAVFHLIAARGERWLPHLIAGAAFTAAAMSTKGPFVAVAIGGALLAHDWRALLKPRWALGLLFGALFLLPVLAALYLQFDVHPEKVMFGRTGVSGVRFFFWDSQFGRFLNTGPLKGYGDPSYFFHVVLWAFLPWSLWLYFAAGARVRAALKKEPSPWGGRELHVWGGALLTMLVFTASRSQLPHYLNICFPFFALGVAAWLARLENVTAKKWAAGLGVAVSVGMPLATAGLLLVVEPPGYLWVTAGVLLVSALSWAVFRGLSVEATLGRAFITAVAVNLALLHSYLPFLLKHQVGRQAAALANTLPPLRTALVDVESLTFDFGLNTEVINWTSDDAVTVLTRDGAPARVLMPAATKQALEARGLEVKVLGTWDYFHVSMPTREFLNARTRASVVEPWVLAELRPLPP